MKSLKLGKRASILASLSVFGLFIAVASLIKNPTNAFSGTGTGTIQDPFIISNCTELQSIATDGDNYQTDGKLYKLGSDIDCTMTNPTDESFDDGGIWGDSTGFDPIQNFDGIFDGDNHTIDGLFINEPLSDDRAGLFGYAGWGSILARVKLTNVQVAGKSQVGGLVGRSEGHIVGVRVSGGVIGAINGVGGIVGSKGSDRGSVSRSSFSGTVTSTGSMVGGLIGYGGNIGIVSNVFADADVTGQDDVGGLIGYVYACCNSVTNAYAVGSVNGGNFVGGLVGRIEGVSADDSIENLFASSVVNATGTKGAVFGYIGPIDPVPISNVAFDQTIANTPDCFGVSNASSVACSAQNTDGLDGGYFYQSSNAPLSSWEFTDVWLAVVEGYPILRQIDELIVPGPVIDISVTFPSAPISAEVAFDAPSDPGSFPVDNYELEVKSASSTWEDIIASESSSTSPILAQSLDMGTDYTARVRALSVYGPGEWTEYAFSTEQQSTVEVSSCASLQALDDTPSNAYVVIVLTQDIDCSGIENFESLDFEDGFFGDLDGQGYSISGLNISVVDTSSIGLFKYTRGSDISNIDFNNPTIFGSEDSYNCGVIAGRMEETNLSNIVVTNATVTCLDSAGGITGIYESQDGISSEVENVSVSGNIHSQSYTVDYEWGPYTNGGNNAGGLFGRASASYEGSVVVTQSYSIATVIADQYSAGGLFGSVDSEIEDDSEMPTLFIIKNSYSSGSVTSNTNAGGIIGRMESYNDGYEALAEIEVEYSYSSATVTAEDSAGGIVGYMDDPYEVGEQYVLNNVFAAGAVSANNLGFALIGSDDGLGDGSLVINNSYFDQTATGQTEASAYDETVFGWTAINTDGSEPNYFKNNSSNPPLDQWDFDNIWIVNYNALPTLRASSPGRDLNGDSIPDGDQPNIAGYVSPITGKLVAFDVGEGCEVTTDDIVSESNLDISDPNYNYENGLFDFTADCGTPGGTTTIKLYYYDVPLNSLTIRKYNPNTKTYFNIPGATLTQQTVNGSSVAVATYQITDGGELDMDGLVNGEIEDPAGLATPSSLLAKTGTPIILLTLSGVLMIATAAITAKKLLVAKE